jgi:hypothetical protein
MAVGRSNPSCLVVGGRLAQSSTYLVDQPVKGSVVSRTTNNCDRVLTCYDLPAVSKVPAHVFRRGQKPTAAGSRLNRQTFGTLTQSRNSRWERKV